MKKFLHYFSNIEKEVAGISEKINPVISDMKEITNDIKEMVDRSRIQFERIEYLSASFIEKGSGILNSINKIQNSGNRVLLTTANLI